jgi:sensor histidine kinase YesM
LVRHSGIEKQEDGRGKISLKREGNLFSIIVEDNGVGFDSEGITANHKSSFGLKHLQELMKYKKRRNNIADVKVESQPGKGVCIYATWAPELESDTQLER